MASKPKEQTRSYIYAINVTFNNIGRSGETVVPAGKSPVSGIAGEFATAQILFKLAKKRLDTAQEAAVAAGLLGSEEFYEPGGVVTTWFAKGASFFLTVKKGSPTQILDRDVLMSNLVKKIGVAPAEALISDSMKPRKGATEFVVVYA